MDSLITAAAQALAAGDVLAALNRVALREDGPALALRGIAMARLGDLARAKALLKMAERAFGPHEAVARARCVVAEAEIALVARDLGQTGSALARAQAILAAHGDWLNVAHAQHLQVRRLLLFGRLQEADAILATVEADLLPPAWRAAHELAVAGIAIRRLQARTAEAALARGEAAADRAGIAALKAEIEAAGRMLLSPTARLVSHGTERSLHLAEIEDLLASDTLVVDAGRHVVRRAGGSVSLASRPVLHALARALAEAWPGEVNRAALLKRAFGARFADESHRARLRVEIARLRAVLRPLATIDATRQGFVLAARDSGAVAVIAPPVEDRHGTVLALMADGEAWSSSALAMALGASPRTVQRAIDALAAEGKIRSVGRGPARRWLAPILPDFATPLLLPGPLPGD